MKDVVHTALTIKPALLVAKALQIRQLRPEITGNLNAQLAEHHRSLGLVCEKAAAATGLQKKWAELSLEKLADNIAGIIVRAQTGSKCQPAAGSGGGGDGALFLPHKTEVAFEGGTEIGDDLFRFFQQLQAY